MKLDLKTVEPTVMMIKLATDRGVIQVKLEKSTVVITTIKLKLKELMKVIATRQEGCLTVVQATTCE